MRASLSSRCASSAASIVLMAAAGLGGVAGLAASAYAQDAAPPGPYHGQKMVRINVRSAAELMRVNQIVTNVWDCRIGVGPLHVQVTPEQEAALVGLGLEPEVMVPDVQALIDAERAQIDRTNLQRDVAWFATYRTLTEINTRLDELAAASGGLATTFSIGNSLEGRAIRGIRFSAPDLPGNPRSGRPIVLINGGQHAREWVNHMTTMFVADQMLERYAAGDARIVSILQRAEVVVVPVVNPDGYEFSWTPNNRLWRKNRRPNPAGSFGVDLNRNWGYEWGGEGSSGTQNNDTYRGPSAFSEPETQALRDFVIANPRIAAHIDFHSFSQLILSPWGYTSQLPPDRPLFAQLDDMLADAIESVNNLRYTAGPAYTTIYPAAGVVPDWMYGARGILSWTIELRDTGTNGFVLPADQIIPTATENFEGVLRLAEYVAEPVRWSFPAAIPEYAQAGAALPLTVTIQSGSQAVSPSTAVLKYQTQPFGSADFQTIPLVPVSGSTYSVQLPAGDCHQTTFFYFEVQTQSGTTVRYPSSVPAAYLAVRWAEVQTRFLDTMETERGWTVGAPGDTATAGLWERAIPQATAAQPGTQVTPGGQFCFITGAQAGTGVGSFDVDGGITTLTSPRINAVPAGRFPQIISSTLAYSRWYSNNAGASPNADSMPIQISTDDGATWSDLEVVSENRAAWVRREIQLAGEPSAQTRLRFVARDLGAGSVVEAAVDDVSLTQLVCPPDIDINRDENSDLLDAQNLAQVVVGLIQPGPDWLEGDIDGNENVDLQDAQWIAIIVLGL